MSATDALRTAQAAGVQIDLDGEDLVLQALAPPPAGVIQLLSSHKTEIVEILRAETSSTARCVESAETAARHTDQSWWRNLFAERAAHYELVGRRRRDDAEKVAWGELLNRWHVEQGERIPRDICAGCRRPIGTDRALDLIDGNGVHLDDANNCLIRHGERWRTTATRALVALGLRPRWVKTV